jgi:hypothetical protein
VFVDDIDSGDPERVSLIVGRALGATHSAMDDGLGSHDEEPGDPWYLKRFFVDGHEYNVVALHMVPATIINPGDEPYEFKYITIRTPVPKVNFINYEDSQKLEGYYRGLVFGEDSDVISVMPPFNSRHTAKEDVQTFPERAIPPTGCPGVRLCQPHILRTSPVVPAQHCGPGMRWRRLEEQASVPDPHRGRRPGPAVLRRAQGKVQR